MRVLIYIIGLFCVVSITAQNDNQILSFSNGNLSISNGNSINQDTRYLLGESRQYISSDLSSNVATDAWYNLFTFDDYQAPVTCSISSYAHSNILFTVTKGYSSNTGKITVLNYDLSPNGNYKYLKGVRIVSGGKVQILLNGGVNVRIFAQIQGTRDNLSLPAVLTLETGTPNVIDEVTNLSPGLIRARDISASRKVNINGEINSGSSASLQVNGWMRTGEIALHEGGDTPTTTSKILKNENSILKWNNNRVITEDWINSTMNFKTYSNTDTDLAGLSTGSNFGKIIESSDYGHFSIGLKNNNIEDAFYIFSTDISNPLGDYTLKLLEVSRANFTYGSSQANKFFIKGSDGKVGIGTTSPVAKLDVEGGDFYLGEEVSGNGQRRQMRIYGYDNSSKFYGTIHSNWEDSKRTFDIYTNSSTNQLKIDASANSSATIGILPGENSGVGIGTLDPGIYKLAVLGKVRATEIKVEAAPWSDFVFYKDYKLPSLEEVEKYIKEKGHLQDIPSAKEVENNGIFLGEMNAKLLQKIEELTLYTIQQQKEIEKLKKEKTELNKLKTKIVQLEKLIKNQN